MKQLPQKGKLNFVSFFVLTIFNFKINKSCFKIYYYLYSKKGIVVNFSEIS